jgi:serine/threonine-protein kinase
VTPKRFYQKPIVRGAAAIIVVLLIAMIRPLKVNDYMPFSPSVTLAPNELYQQGLDLLERYDKPQNLNAAIQKFDQTTKADPNFALAYAGLGEAYVDKYRQEQNPDFLKTAEGHCQTAIRLNDQLPEVHVTLGRIHDLSGKHDLGLQEILRALKLDPLNIKGLLALGDAYANVSRNDEAERAYTKAIALRPNNWDAYQRHGYFFFRRGRNKEAAEQYRNAIQLAPDNARAHSNLAAVLLNLGDTAEAEKEMKTAVTLGPTYPAYYNFAFFYYGQKRYAEAAEMARKAAELNGNDYRIWQMLGLSYEWMGETKKAKDAYARELQELLKAEKVKADDPAAQAEIAVLYSKLRDRANAETHMKTATALAPNDSTVLSLVGEAYENLGDRATALDFIERSIQNGSTVDDLKSNPDLRRFLADREVQARLASMSNKIESTAKN